MKKQVRKPFFNKTKQVLQLFLGAAAFHEWEALPTGRVLLFLGFSFLCVLAVGLIDPKDSLTEKLEAAEALQKEDDCKPGDGRTVEMSFEDLSDMEGGSVKSHHIHVTTFSIFKTFFFRFVTGNHI